MTQLLGSTQRHHRASQRSSGGYTLLEALLVVALVSTVVMMFALGLLTVTRTDGQTKEQQQLSGALTSFSEGLRRTSFLECCPVGPGCLNGASDVEGAWMDNFASLLLTDAGLSEALAGLTSYDITGVSYWQPGSFDTPSSTIPGSFGDTCVPGSGVVRLDLEVVSGDATELGEVVVRKQEAS